MVKMRALRGLSVPKDEAAAKRVKAGKAKAGDWTSVECGAPFSPPESVRKALIESGDAEEVGSR